MLKIFLIVTCLLLAVPNEYSQCKRIASPKPDDLEKYLDPIDANKWKPLIETPLDVVSYDPSSRKLTKQKTVTIWILIEPKNLPEARKEYSDAARESGSKANFDEYTHSVHFYEIRCAERKLRVLAAFDYTEDGRVVSSRDYALAWGNVVPDSIGEAMLKAACYPSGEDLLDQPRGKKSKRKN